jgi:glycosyltransferase involved in cell wall biosynthesis
LVNRARRRNLLFREHFRHFDVAPGAFDLVHAHVFSLAIYGARLPVVVSNALRISDLYVDAFNEAPPKVAYKAVLDRWLARKTGVLHTSFPSSQASAVVVFTSWLRDEMAAQGVPEHLITVVPPSIEVPPLTHSPLRRPVRLGFIGDWDAKGGAVVLEAHKRLIRAGYDVELLIVGSEPRLDPAACEALRISWHPRVDRDTLRGAIMPTISVFVYPSRCDGLPLTLLEIMAAGIPVVVSNYKALPEVVSFGRAGHVVNSYEPEDYAAAVVRLMAPELHRSLGAAARDHVLARHSHSTTSPALAAVYRQAVLRHRHGRGPHA